MLTSRFGLNHFLMLALCGSLFLAGCPAASDLSGEASATKTVVDGVQGGPAICEAPPNEAILVERALELVNQERSNRGLHTLTLNPKLSQIAADYCCEMIEGSFFSHINPITGEGPAQRAVNGDYLFLAIGENLAGGQTSPEQVVTDWMNSTEGHRENILATQWSEVGIAIRTGGEYGVYWVQEFGNPP